MDCPEQTSGPKLDSLTLWCKYTFNLTLSYAVCTDEGPLTSALWTFETESETDGLTYFLINLANNFLATWGIHKTLKCYCQIDS